MLAVRPRGAWVNIGSVSNNLAVRATSKGGFLMGKYTTYVGMDVHARSVTASAVDTSTGEVFSRTFSGAAMGQEIAAWARGLPQPAYCAYESGCTGFALARELRAAGLDCDVIAVSTLPLSQRDRRRKCDRLDARAIRREIANPDASHGVVWVPGEKTEGERDLCRAYYQAVADCKRAKQRLLMFLMRHGHVWDERTRTGRRRKPTGRAFEAWLATVRLAEPSAERAFESYRRQVRAAAEEVATLRGEVRELAASPGNRPYVDALRCVKGIQAETAMLAVAEIGDFSRFPSGRRVSSWLGTVPTDGSSGERDRHGGITKAGNKYLRRALVEGWSGAASWRSGRKAVPRGAVVSAEAQALCARANARLFGRYGHLTSAGKCHNKAKVAVVSELVRWVWVIGLQVQRELASPA